MSTAEFTQIDEDRSKPPHEFIAVEYHSDDCGDFSQAVEACLGAWRLSSDVFREKVEGTGFGVGGIVRALNRFGHSRLPPTPPDNSQITKSPHLTDITEVIALRAVRHLRPNARVPHPRVLHKEITRLQHHGIDVIE